MRKNNNDPEGGFGSFMPMIGTLILVAGFLAWAFLWTYQ